jgi:hypothetical protein
MKLSRILFACAAIGGTQAALADLTNANPAGLGQSAAIMQFCAKVDPSDSATFQAMWSDIVGAGQQSHLAGIESSGAYKQSFDRVTAMLKAIPKNQLAKGCAGGASEWRDHPAAKPGHHRDRVAEHD